MVGVLIGAVIARHHRHPGPFHQRLGRILEPHRTDRPGTGADEHQPGRRDLIDEIGVFGQKAIAGVNGLGAAGKGGGDDRIAAQIAFRGGGPTDMHRAVGHGHMAGTRVGVGMDGHGFHAHPAAGVDDAAGDFATVGDQDTAEHGLFTS